jgi:hypothetical protein
MNDIKGNILYSYIFCSPFLFRLQLICKEAAALDTPNQLTTIPVSFCNYTSQVMVTFLCCYVQFMNLSFNFLHVSVICYYKGPEKLGEIWIKLDTLVSDDGANLLDEKINNTKKEHPQAMWGGSKKVLEVKDDITLILIMKANEMHYFSNLFDKFEK